MTKRRWRSRESIQRHALGSIKGTWTHHKRTKHDGEASPKCDMCRRLAGAQEYFGDINHVYWEAH